MSIRSLIIVGVARAALVGKERGVAVAAEAVSAEVSVTSEARVGASYL